MDLLLPVQFNMQTDAMTDGRALRCCCSFVPLSTDQRRSAPLHLCEMGRRLTSTPPLSSSLHLPSSSSFPLRILIYLRRREASAAASGGADTVLIRNSLSPSSFLRSFVPSSGIKEQAEREGIEDGERGAELDSSVSGQHYQN